MKGGQQMLELIKDCAQEIYGDENGKKVAPDVEPGFLRKELSETAPEEGKEVEHLIEMTRKVLFPGCVKWTSPKFFGYYTSSVNVTSIFGDMVNVIAHSPNFSYAVSPSWTELENVVSDWTVQAMGLP